MLFKKTGLCAACAALLMICLCLPVTAEDAAPSQALIEQLAVAYAAYGGKDEQALAELSAADHEATAIRGETYDLESELGHYETMMNYYYDLCSEFRGHEKHEALVLRIKSKFGDLDESGRMLFNLFTCDDAKIQDQFFQKEKELGNRLGKEQNNLNERISQLQETIDRPMRFKERLEANARAIVVLLVVLAVIFGGLLLAL